MVALTVGLWAALSANQLVGLKDDQRAASKDCHWVVPWDSQKADWRAGEKVCH